MLCVHCSVTKLRSIALRFCLHGVSHDAASPMPVPSNSRVVGICGRFFCECAIIFEIKGRFGTVVAIL